MKSGKMSKRARSRRAPSSSNILSASVFGVLVGLIITVALLIVFCLVCLNSKNPDSLISPLALTINAVAYFAAGFAASKKRSAPLPCGALSGAILCAVFFVISLALKDLHSAFSAPSIAILLRLVSVFISIIGALIGANCGKNRRYSNY